MRCVKLCLDKFWTCPTQKGVRGSGLIGSGQTHFPLREHCHNFSTRMEVLCADVIFFFICRLDLLMMFP